MNFLNIFKRKPKTLADYHPDWLLWEEGDTVQNTRLIYNAYFDSFSDK